MFESFVVTGLKPDVYKGLTKDKKIVVRDRREVIPPSFGRYQFFCMAR
jgi:hypothetical protein